MYLKYVWSCRFFLDAKHWIIQVQREVDLCTYSIGVGEVSGISQPATEVVISASPVWKQEQMLLWQQDIISCHHWKDQTEAVATNEKRQHQCKVNNLKLLTQVKTINRLFNNALFESPLISNTRLFLSPIWSHCLNFQVINITFWYFSMLIRIMMLIHLDKWGDGLK